MENDRLTIRINNEDKKEFLYKCRVIGVNPSQAIKYWMKNASLTDLSLHEKEKALNDLKEKMINGVNNLINK